MEQNDKAYGISYTEDKRGVCGAQCDEPQPPGSIKHRHFKRFLIPNSQVTKTSLLRRLLLFKLYITKR